MTVIYPNKFKASKPAGYDGLFDWDFLIPAFSGTKITPMDFDCVIERYGYFLIIETKSKGKDIPTGQQIALRNIVLIGKGKIHVMILYGKSSDDICEIDEWYFKINNCLKSGVRKCDSNYVLKRVSAWFNWASLKNNR